MNKLSKSVGSEWKENSNFPGCDQRRQSENIFNGKSFERENMFGNVLRNKNFHILYDDTLTLGWLNGYLSEDNN